MLASGTNRPSISTSSERVPRMPSVFQVSRIFTSGAFIGTGKWMTASGSLSECTTAPVISTSPAAAADVNTLRAEIRYPPSTFSALPEPPIQSEPPLVKRMMRSLATRFSSGSTAATFW